MDPGWIFSITFFFLPLITQFVFLAAVIMLFRKVTTKATTLLLVGAALSTLGVLALQIAAFPLRGYANIALALGGVLQTVGFFWFVLKLPGTGSRS